MQPLRYLYGLERAKVDACLLGGMIKRTCERLRRERFGALQALNFVAALRTLSRCFKGTKYVSFAGSTYVDCTAPKWPGRAFDRTLDALVEGLGRKPGTSPAYIPYLVLSITRKCVYRCEHCYAIQTLGTGDVLSYEQLLQMARDFQRIGVGVIAWEGGEPLMRFDDLVKLIEATHHDSDAWLATTAAGLTPARAARLREAGLAAAIISLDHHEPDRQNAFRRNRNAFDLAVRGVRTFREAGILPSLSVCATREFMAEEGLYPYMELARDLGVAYVQIVDPMPSGNYSGADVLLSEEQLEEIHELQYRFNTEPRYRDYPGVSSRVHLESESCFGCSAANGVCHVDALGNVQPCVFLQMSFGNIREQAVADIYSEMRAHFPQFMEGRCPAQTLAVEVAGCAEAHGALPVPHDRFADILEGLRGRRLPRNLRRAKAKLERRRWRDLFRRPAVETNGQVAPSRSESESH